MLSSIAVTEDETNTSLISSGLRKSVVEDTASETTSLKRGREEDEESEEELTLLQLKKRQKTENLNSYFRQKKVWNGIAEEGDVSSKEEDPYLLAQKVLNISHVPQQLLCRDRQVSKLRNELRASLQEKESASFYLSGCPGTGKTASVDQVLREFVENGEVKKSSIFRFNCMRLRKPNDIYRQLGVSKETMSDRFCRGGKMKIVVLDEIDQLRNDIICHFFKAPSAEKSKLILIGIANSIDLIDKIYDKLSFFRKTPICINYPVYENTEICQIIQNRLKHVHVPVLVNSAVELCSRKISYISGDIRKALDVCKRAVNEAKAKQCATVADVSNILKGVYGEDPATSIQSLPVQHQTVFFACLKPFMERNEVKFDELRSEYLRYCLQSRLPKPNSSEFYDICRALCDSGVYTMSEIKRKAGRKSKKQSLPSECSIICNLSVEDAKFVFRKCDCHEPILNELMSLI